MSNRKHLSPYWLCQIVGWGAVAPYWFYYEARGGFAIYWVVLSVLSQVSLQIFVTDQYRRLVHRRGWLALPLRQLLPIVLVAWLLLVTQYMVMAYTIFELKFDHSYFEEDTALGAIAGGSRYHAIWLLAFHLFHFARQSANQRTAVAEAQLAKLSNELNPHFLFNALNGIKGLTREDPARARNAIDRLAELLRYSLRKSTKPLVPLTEELAIINEYIALERMRLEERLTFTMNIPEDTTQCYVLPLSLHSLLENAVKHGIAQLPEGGTIELVLHKKSSYWEFTVRNPYPALIQKNGNYEKNPSGTGLRNLKERLRLQYGKHGNLILKQKDASFIAIMQIPL
ncbi:MAG: histidine kinase [Bacteroidota bacterium]